MGKIIVIEGTDCSGKSTQFEKLCERLGKENVAFSTASFPDYPSESSWFVRQYLAGEFGEHASDVDAKTASVFYAVDRYASYMKCEWGKTYREGGNILLARYITSNILHQACKLETEEEKQELIDWLHEFEIETMGIPKYDEVILLNMPPEQAKILKAKRGQTSSGGEKDIHEADDAHLRAAYETSLWVAKKYGWTIINCVDEAGNLRTIEDIHEEIYEKAMKIFSK
ncbi:MAG: thymidylate kinase [Clostridia bacterium]|nr:thymidylate kinase [Clostridia bacterium]